MASSSVPHTSAKSAVWLIGSGLALILAAQVFERVPVASAIAVIAWGALQMLRDRGAGSMTIAMNFVIYAMLVAFTIASRTHAAVIVRNETVTLALLTDQALAITLLVALLISSCGNESAEDADI